MLPFETFLKLSPIACKLYLLIFQLRDESGHCTYNKAALAPGIPCSARTVQRALAELRIHNLIAVQTRGPHCTISLPLLPQPSMAATPSVSPTPEPPMSSETPVSPLATPSMSPTPTMSPPGETPLSPFPTGAIDNADLDPTQTQSPGSPGAMPSMAGLINELTALTAILRTTA